MSSGFILDAIRAKYPAAAIVPELTIEDFDLPDTGAPVEHLFHHGGPRPEGHSYSRRIDAVMWESLVRTAIEIKISKADFLRDGTPTKQQHDHG